MYHKCYTLINLANVISILKVITLVTYGVYHTRAWKKVIKKKFIYKLKTLSLELRIFIDSNYFLKNVATIRNY